MRRLDFTLSLPGRPPLTWGDVVVLAAIGAALWLAARLAFHAPAVVKGPEFPSPLPRCPGMRRCLFCACWRPMGCRCFFAVSYGLYAAHNRRAERVLLPLLDVLQSAPILSFLPVVLLSLTVILPAGVAVELASIVLILASQAWHLPSVPTSRRAPCRGN
jgi:NitT/TauT family transport system permease protein